MRARISGVWLNTRSGLILNTVPVLWIHTHFFGFGLGSTFFSDSNSVSDSDSYTNILNRNFLKWCLSLLLLYMCTGICTTEKKVFHLKNLRFSLSSVWYAIFHKKFVFYNSVWIRIQIEIRTFFSDSDPAKIFEFFRIRSTTLLDTENSRISG
jgi:hypothetical protein